MSKKTKKGQLEKLKPKRYRIYGIFNFKTNKLIQVSMDIESVDLDFDISDYDTEVFDIVSFDVLLA